MSSINSLSNSFLQAILGNGLQGVGLNANSKTTTQAGLSGLTQQPDSQQLSPFAQLVSTLQQLQQSDPAKYSQVTQQIATNLQSAAQSAQSSGNTTAAAQLNQLATDFTSASKSGQLPNIQDLAQAVSGGHHHGHHHHASAASDSDSASSGSTSSGSTSSTSTASTVASSQSLDQILGLFVGLFQTATNPAAGGGQSGSLDAGSIIRNTLSNAGVGSATSF
jgi:hypothetical protein